MADAPAIDTKYQMTPSEASGGQAGQQAYFSRVGVGGAPAAPAPQVNPGASVKYDPNNPFNVGVSGTGNFAGAGTKPAYGVNAMTGNPNPAPVGVPDTTTTPSPQTEFPTKSPEEAATEARNFALSNAQDQIDNINKSFDEQLQRELEAAKPAEENALGRTNALSAMMGLAGSSSADTRSAVTEKYNANINEGITSKVQAQKMAALSAIYGQVDKFSSDAYLKQISLNQTNQKAQLDAQVKNGDQLLSSFANQFSGIGKSFEDFKSLDNGTTLTKLENMTGKSEYQLRQDWNKSLPENLQPHVVDASYQNADGTTHYKEIQVDPVSGKQTVVTEQDLSTPFANYNGGKNLISGPNGEKYAPALDDKGNVIYKPIGIGKAQTINAGKYGSFQYDPVTDSWKQISAPAPSSSSSGAQLSKTDYSRLESAGVDRNMADGITTAIISGYTLEDIRSWMRQNGVDPKVLDTYDTAVGIARIQKFAKPKSSGSSGNFGFPPSGNTNSASTTPIAP